MSTIDHVSDTALWVAHYRAQETERPDALFRDPLAKLLVGERGRAIAKTMDKNSKYVAWSLSIRTCVIDQYILNFIAQGIDLVVNLGAGLDTRPYRMGLPATLKWVEVDYPHMIDHKERLLGQEKPTCQLERIRLDLADRPKRLDLLAELATRSQNILVITEGVIPYLSETQVAELADDLHAQRGVRYWIAEYFAASMYPYLNNPQRNEQMKNAPFVFFPEDWFGFFKKNGWAPQEIKYLAEESEKLGRKIPAPWWTLIFAPFRHTERAQHYKRLMGYVVFSKI